MEHWAWTPSVLARFARHYETGEPMPAELMEQMARARFVNVGLRTAMQAYYGQIDLAIHAEPVTPDIDAAMRRTFEVTGLPYPEGTFFLSGFAHLLGGYDAGYYGYLWANVIGDDMFSRFSVGGRAVAGGRGRISARDPRAERLARRRRSRARVPRPRPVERRVPPTARDGLIARRSYRVRRRRATSR